MALTDSWVQKKFSPADELEVQRQESLLEEMGLESRDVNQLRSQMVSAEEAVAAKAEELEKIRAHKGRKKDWEEFVDAKRRMGRVMHHSEFLARLRKLIPNLILNDGRVKDTVSMYIWRRNSYTDPETKKLQSGIVYLGWVSTLYIPEFEIDIVNDAKVAIGQKRGWRTVLLRLLTRREPTECNCSHKFEPRRYACICPPGRPENLVSENAVRKEFGYPSGATSAVYLRQLHQFRNG